jgi:hypothetical protein
MTALGTTNPKLERALLDGLTNNTSAPAETLRANLPVKARDPRSLLAAGNPNNFTLLACLAPWPSGH